MKNGVNIGCLFIEKADADFFLGAEGAGVYAVVRNVLRKRLKNSIEAALNTGISERGLYVAQGEVKALRQILNDLEMIASHKEEEEEAPLTEEQAEEDFEQIISEVS